MSEVSRLQSFANALLGIYNAVMDVYVRWEANDPSLGPRRSGPHFEDCVSDSTDLNGLWAWLQETGAEIDAETFKKKVEEEGIDAFRPCEVLTCDWQKDIVTGIGFAKDMAGRGLAEIIIPPPGNDSKQWLMEVLHCADEAKELVVLAGLTPTTLECDSEPGNCQDLAASKHRDCMKRRHDQVKQLPITADRLLKYRQWILTQVSVEGTSDGVVHKDTCGEGDSHTTRDRAPCDNSAGQQGYAEAGAALPDQQRFFLHYWPNHPIYVCLRDRQKRPFDFNRGAFTPTAELQDLSHACLPANEKLEWRADYGCSYSVSIDSSFSITP